MSNASRKPRVFISRTTAGLAAIAERVAEVLRQRGIEPIIQTGFYPSTHDVKGMLAEHLQQCDAVICLIGSAYGSGPHDPITKAEQPVHGLKDPRTKDRLFSYTQLELLIARDLGRPIYTFFIEEQKPHSQSPLPLLLRPTAAKTERPTNSNSPQKGQGAGNAKAEVVLTHALLTAFAPEPPELAQRQQTFITEFAKDGRNTYGTFTQWHHPADPARGLKQAIEAIQFEITVLAGKPTNLPYTSLGTLFKGRDEFLAELRQHLTAEGPVVIKGKRTIHGMGGVGKTRAAIEYAWKHGDDYRALLFISADTPEALHRNLAALCGPLVLNLPEQNEKEQALQVEADLRWLKLHPGWFLIIDNVDTDEAAEETKALLAKLATGHVLITSRISDWTGHIKSLDLDVLSEAASIAFLDERTEERRPKKDDDHEKVAALVQILDCLALALEQAGAHISTNAISYADYMALWESHRTDVLAWHDEEKMKYPKSLAITYETSVAQLSDGAKKLFLILAWFAPDPIPRDLLNIRPNFSEGRHHLVELERIHLASFLGDGQAFTIHRLNQEIARQNQDSESELQMLIHALEWVESAFKGDAADVRTWAKLIPLVAHAQTVAFFGDSHTLFGPSARLMRESALLLSARAQYKNADKLARRALVLDEIIYGTAHLEVARDLNTLGQILQAMNCLAEAEESMRRTLAIIQHELAKNDAMIVDAMNNLAALLQETNRLTEAEKLMRDALAIMEANQSSDQATIGTLIMNLGTILQMTNRLSESEYFMRRALAIDETIFGKDHPKVAIDLSNIGSLLYAMNDFAGAEPLMRRALAIDERSYGVEHPNVAIRLGNLGLLLSRSSGYMDEGKDLLSRAISIDEACYGKDHPRVASSLSNLATLFLNINSHEKAEALFRRALMIDKKSYGPDHPEVATNLNNLAQCLLRLRRQSEAAPLLRQHVLIYMRFLETTSHWHPNLDQALHNYALFLQELKGDPAVMPEIRSLGKEAGLSNAKVDDIIAHSFGS